MDVLYLLTVQSLLNTMFTCLIALVYRTEMR